MSRRVLRTIGCLGLAILGVLLAIYAPKLAQVRNANQFVLDAYQEHRTLELRISGAAHGPMFDVTHPARPEDSFPSSLLKAEASLLMLRPNEKRSPEVRAICGRVFLLQGRYEAAIGEFQQALETCTPAADLLDDLASAYFQRAAHFEKPSAPGLQSEGPSLNPRIVSKGLTVSPSARAAYAKYFVCERIRVNAR
jgi:tetratricopeptide (TPR) repeat protein